MSKVTIQKKLVKTSLWVLVPALLVVTLAVVALNVWVSLSNRGQTVQRIESSLSAKGRILTSNNAQALAGMAENNAFLQIQALVASTVKDDPDVIYGAFMMADSSLPWAISKEGDSVGMLAKADTLKDTSLTWVRLQKKLAQRQVMNEDVAVFEFAAPVGDPEAPLGWIRYGLSTSSMKEAIATETRRAILGLGVVVLLLTGLGGAVLAVALQRFRSAAEKLSGPVRELATAAGIIQAGDYKKEVKVESDDEIGDLADTFEKMRATVQNYTEHLEDLIAEKMRQVRDILDNVEQGLFVVNFDGTINPEHSKRATEILGTEKLDHVRDALHLSPSQESDFMGWLQIVQNMSKTMRWEKLVRVAPVQELEIAEESGELRFVRVRYQQMYDKNRNLDKIMVLATDETEARRIEKIVAEEKARHENEVRTILGLVNNLPEAIKDFEKDADRRLQDLKESFENMQRRAIKAREQYPDGPGFKPLSDEVQRVFRDLHTIKGNAGTYGFERLAHLAHEGEDILEDLQEPITVRTTVTLDKLLQKVVEMEQAYEEILETEKKLGGAGGDGDTLVQISERKLEHIDKVARTLSVGAGLSDPEAVRPLLDACVRLRDVALPRLADKYRSMLERVAEKLGKQISFECAPHHLEVDPHFFAPIDEALIHILRNSVDHGLESPADRVSAGKPEVGTILLQVVPNDDYVNVILKDDGGGIDADRVVRKAIEEQVITADDAASMSMEQKLGLIFESGVSTAAEVSDISGRGVGMAAVRECIEGLGGSIVLRSEVGKGTELTLQLPARFLRS